MEWFGDLDGERKHRVEHSPIRTGQIQVAYRIDSHTAEVLELVEQYLG